MIGIGDAIGVHQPDLVVLAGGDLADKAVANWAHQVRHTAGAIPIVLYRRGDQRQRMPTTGTLTLPAGAGEARQLLLELVEADRGLTRMPASAHSGDSYWSSASRRIASV
jgi:hypothetical protein